MPKKPRRTSQAEIRKRVVFEYLNGAKAKDLAIKYNLHRSTIPKMAKRCRTRRTADRISGSGRKKILKRGHKIKITSSIRKNPRLTLQELRNLSNAPCSRYTIRRYLIESGLKSFKLQKKLDLSDAHKISRVNWALANLNRDWSCVLFSDETSIWLHEVSGRVWVPTRSQAYFPSPSHSAKLHVWAAISIYGTIGLSMFEGILTSQRYVEILEDQLCWGADEAFGSGQWVFQQDNDPKHRSHYTQCWLLANVPEMLPWPSRSPDLSPIENLWAYIKKRIRKRGPKDLFELRIFVEEEFRSLPISYFHNLYESMHNRIRLVIERNGDAIGY